MALALAASLSACPIERAHYALRTQPDVTARFVDIATDNEWHLGIAMKLHVGASGRTYWWLPWNGGSDGKQNLASTTDPTVAGWQPGGPRPLGDVDFIAADADYNLLDHIPGQKEIAPAHFLISDLRQALWYSTPMDARDATVRQFFDLVDCAPLSK